MKKFIFCAGVLFCAPFVASFAVDVAVAKVEHHMQIAACEKTAALDKIIKECR